MEQENARNGPIQPDKPCHWWMLTIPAVDWNPPTVLPAGITYMQGQQELGGRTGYLHWQVCCYVSRRSRRAAVKRMFPISTHLQWTHSEAGRNYCWKEDTRIEGTMFKLGHPPLRRNEKPDWDAIRAAAKRGDLDAECIPGQVFVQNYFALKKIRGDYVRPVAMVREVHVFWGVTGSGKSHRAWSEAGPDAYCKEPRTKWWCGYNGQESVVLDEFRGNIDISYILRWWDRYPVRVETKGDNASFSVRKWYVTSNLPPSQWYPELDDETRRALLRRLTTVTHFDRPFVVPEGVEVVEAINHVLEYLVQSFPL